MKRLILKSTYSEAFTHYYLPRLFLKLIKTELNKPVNKTILNYIRKVYNISHNELDNLLAANIQVSKYADNIVIKFNNIKVKELENGEPVFLETLIDLMNDGNLEIRGLNIISNIINYLGSHLFTSYKLWKIRRSSDIWL